MISKTIVLTRQTPVKGLRVKLFLNSQNVWSYTAGECYRLDEKCYLANCGVQLQLVHREFYISAKQGETN